MSDDRFRIIGPDGKPIQARPEDVERFLAPPFRMTEAQRRIRALDQSRPPGPRIAWDWCKEAE